MRIIRLWAAPARGTRVHHERRPVNQHKIRQRHPPPLRWRLIASHEGGGASSAGSSEDAVGPLPGCRHQLLRRGRYGRSVSAARRGSSTPFSTPFVAGFLGCPCVCAVVRWCTEMGCGLRRSGARWTPAHVCEHAAIDWGSSGRVFKPCQLLTCGMWESQLLTDNQSELKPAWSHRSWREWHD
jgi:hypothetical protein